MGRKKDSLSQRQVAVPFGELGHGHVLSPRAHSQFSHQVLRPATVWVPSIFSELTHAAYEEKRRALDH